MGAGGVVTGAVEFVVKSRELEFGAVPLSAGEVDVRLAELAEGLTIVFESLLRFDPSKLRKRLDIEEEKEDQMKESSKDQGEMRRYSGRHNERENSTAKEFRR